MLYVRISQRMVHIHDWELGQVKNKTKQKSTTGRIPQYKKQITMTEAMTES